MTWLCSTKNKRNIYVVDMVRKRFVYYYLGKDMRKLTKFVLDSRLEHSGAVLLLPYLMTTGDSK